MARTRRARCKRNQQRGGGLGSTYGFAANSYGGEGIISNPLAYTTSSSCVSAPRPGFMDNGYTGAKGLPGLSGGSRKEGKGRKGARKSMKKQSGGRYGFDGSDLTGMGAPWASARASVDHVPCEASRTAIPDSGAAGVLNKVGGPLWDAPRQQGGANPAIASASASAGVDGPNSEFYIAPTAGYTHLRTGADSIQTSAGTYEMINVPQNAREMNPACLKTGGGRKRSSSRKARKAVQKKRSSRSRKGSRKSKN